MGQERDSKGLVCGTKRKLDDECQVEKKKPRFEVETSLEYLQGDNQGVVVLSLNRPDACNAISTIMLEELEAAMEELQKEESVRCLIITSKVPGIFSAGADLKERCQMDEASVKSYLSRLNKFIISLEEFHSPVIAAVEGVCLGGGLEICLGCDIIIGSSCSTFGMPEVRIGVLPGAGGTVRLGKCIGWSRARQMILTGDRIGGRKAEDWGLLGKCAQKGDTLGAALEMARQVTAGGPLAIKYAKLSLRSAEILEKDEALQMERKCYARILPTWDRKEGLNAWSSRRKPCFSGK